MAIPPRITVTHTLKISKPGYAEIVEELKFADEPSYDARKAGGYLTTTIIIDTREKAIRDALLAIGWTPPVDGALA